MPAQSYCQPNRATKVPRRNKTNDFSYSVFAFFSFRVVAITLARCSFGLTPTERQLAGTLYGLKNTTSGDG
jgi:hypothetical protein